MQWSITLCQTAFPDSFAKIAIFRHIHWTSLAEPLCRFPITPIIPIIPVVPIVLIIPIVPIVPIVPIKILVVLYCGMIAFWVFEGRFWQKNREKKCEKIWLLTKKGVPLHSLFGNDADGMRAGALRG